MKRESEAPLDRYIEIEVSHPNESPVATHGFKTVTPPPPPREAEQGAGRPYRTAGDLLGPEPRIAPVRQLIVRLLGEVVRATVTVSPPCENPRQHDRSIERLARSTE